MERGGDQTGVHITILYVLIVLLAATLLVILLVEPRSTKEQDSWACNTVVCAQHTDVETWRAANCAPADGGEGVTLVCKVNVDGVEQLIPWALINSTYLAEQCLEYACVQEVRVRPANYTVVPGVVRSYS